MEQPAEGLEPKQTGPNLEIESGGRRPSLDELHLDDLLKEAVELGSSDLHLAAGSPPIVRTDGKLVRLDYEELDPRSVQRFVYDVLTGEQIRAFETTKELDFGYGIPDVGRFRVNAYRQRGCVGVALRAIPTEIPTLSELRLPPSVRDLALKQSGLILVTGPTGNGKTTTLAGMVGIINSERNVHIMTIEDPIEYLHKHKKSMVNQRELGFDTDSFHNALRAVLREDPDVILVGEMRDLETIQAALTLAETGHLVFATLHTRNAPQTIDRVVDVFPPHQQDQIKVQLSSSIEAVLAQQLLPMIGGGRICALEILIGTSGVRNLIREGKTHQIGSLMETSAQFGMQTMDTVLVKLHRNGKVNLDEARKRAIDPENFDRLLGEI